MGPAPPEDPDMPTLQDFEIASTVVRYSRGNRMLIAYQSRPRTFGHYPGVLVLHDLEGLTDQERHLTRRLADQEFVAKAFDIYSRAEVPKAKRIAEVADRAKWFAKLPDRRVMDDLERTWEVMRRLHWTYGKRCGVVGFGMGAYYALLLNGMMEDCAACVAVAPRFTEQPDAPKKGEDLKPFKLDQALYNAGSDVLMFLPGNDPECTPAQGERLLDLCDRQSISAIPVRYPEAGARFYVEGQEGYSDASARDMWQGIMAYLESKLR